MRADMRDVFSDTVFEFMKQDSKILFLSCDQGINLIERLKKELPNQYLFMGVAEQNAVGVAAGLAKEGYKTILFAITPFLAYRAFEFLKIDIGYNKQPVLIVGNGPGFTYSFEGSSHHAISDVALMRQIPELQIYNPCDPSSLAKSLFDWVVTPLPTYLRLEKGVYEDLAQPPSHNIFFRQLIKPSQAPLTIWTTGAIAHMVVKIVQQSPVLKDHCNLIVVDQLHPFPFPDEEGQIGIPGDHVVIEEHKSGGLFSILAEAYIDHGTRIFHQTLLDRKDHQHLYGSREWMLRQHKMDQEFLTQRLELLYRNLYE